MRIATHSGTFHADELFALATLRLVHGELEIVRTRDRALQAAADVRVDVGHRHDPATGDFDHHQRGGAGERPNGVKYASFGLVWQTFGAAACGGDAAVAASVEQSLVVSIDAHDTGQSLCAPVLPDASPMTVSGMLAACNPRWDEPDDEAAQRAAFDTALALADGILRREIAGATATAKAQALVAEAVARAEDPRVVVLDRGLPWHGAIHAHAPEALFVVLPKSSGWGVQAVPAVLGRFENRKDLPEAWGGLEGEALAAVSGVPDAVFCHGARFLAVAGSREGAMAMVAAALAD